MNKNFTQKLSFTCIAILITICSFAQVNNHNWCGTEYSHINEHEHFQAHQLQDSIKFNEFLLREEFLRTDASGIIAEIPIVVHVIHKGEAVGTGTNISDAKVKSQIDILNADFGKTGYNSANVVAAFKNLAADTKIRFKLATVDPQGNPTTGINRVKTTKTGFEYPDGAKTKAGGGADPWDQKRYLNVWVVPLLLYQGQDVGLIGTGQFPDDPKGMATYGFVVKYKMWGNLAPVDPGYEYGRTATHEIGHCLGLKHLWGSGANNNSCSVANDDGISDTPIQDKAYQGPTASNCLLTQTACGGKLMMVQNFMNYASDNCYALFTLGQAARMKYVLETYLPTFLPVLTGVDDVNESNITISPNPVNDKHIHLSAPVDKISILNLNGEVLQVDENTNQIDLASHISSGIYIAQIISKNKIQTMKLIIE